MNNLNLPNTMYKLGTIKGNSMAGTIAMGLFAVLMAAVGVIGLFTGGIFTGLLLIVVGGGLAYVMFASIPKEKKQVAESWARLSPQEIYNIEMEAPSAPVVGTAFVTRDALVRKVSQGPLVIPARDIMWIYGKQVTQKMYGLITTGKTFSTIVVDRQGERHELAAKKGTSEEQLQTLLNVLRPNYPGIVFGYRQEIEALATKENISKLAEYVDGQNSKAHA